MIKKEKHLTIGMVIGEPSGDALASALLKVLYRHYNNLKVIGIVGPLCQAQGAISLFPMERLSIMGLIEPIKRLPELVMIKRSLIKYFKTNKPDIFIGVDSPDFNLRIEQALRKAGIKTVHYVSPSVWAWRQKRIHTIKKAADLMLTLLPFEDAIYTKHEIPVKFTGHPIADEIPLIIDSKTAKQSLNVPVNKKIVTVLPGSRDNELKYLLDNYIDALLKLSKDIVNLHVIWPVINSKHKEIVLNKCAKVVGFTYQVFISKTRTAIAAADVVCVTSGTATLEVLLHKKPMIVAYRMNILSYWIVKMLIKVPYISLPNLLTNSPLVPELIQSDANPDNIAKHLRILLKSPAACLLQTNIFNSLHLKLRQNAADKAASAVMELLC